jgi:4-hydroxybenzoate polyprenyltransferase
MIIQYFRERFPPVRFLPLAAGLTIAASAGRHEIMTMLADVATALLLLAQFRLWDDLADRPADAIHHPERLLVNVPSVDPFVRLCVALGFVNLMVSAVGDDSGIPLAVLATLHAVTGAWYLSRSHRSLIGDQLLLAKYPAFVLMLSGARVQEAPGLAVLSATVVYIMASAYEAWHDPASPIRASGLIRAIRGIHAGGGS